MPCSEAWKDPTVNTPSSCNYVSSNLLDYFTPLYYLLTSRQVCPFTSTMTWWRRDSTISPVQRYAQRLLRSHEAALRTRGFSRTPSKAAQHEDDKGSNRPAGMSNLEWMQSQHYQRWRKRLMEDPYHVLFGASNDMLNGKGLKDWEWISNTFPKWMLREMDGHEDATQQPKRDKDSNPSARFPKKVEINNDEPSAPGKRDSYFPQPTIRATRIDRDDFGGIVSPSDLRRPREQPDFPVSVEIKEAEIEFSSKPSASLPPADPPQVINLSPPTPPKSIQSFSDYIAQTKSKAANEIKQSIQPTVVKDESFMDGFLADEPTVSTPSITSSWRETALQRRSLESSSTKSEASKEPLETMPTAQENETMLSSPVADERSATQTVNQMIPAEVVNEGQDLPPVNETDKPQTIAPTARTTSEKLSQLPEDDLDFLSAADIRASMGARKSKILSDEQKKSARENLERSFADAHAKGDEVHPMIESKIINDQFVRRTERKMRFSDVSKEINDPASGRETDTTSNLASENQLESSIERMKSWLEQGGAMFANYFWQDPTEEADAKKTRLFFDKVLARVRKGRTAMKQVIEDLETDIPSSKQLLRRMKTDEDVLDSAIHALRQRSGSDKIQPLSPRKVRAIQSLRLKYQDTDNDLSKAYAALDEIGKSDAAKNVSLAFKRRLVIGSKIIQKNAHLTRYLIWSLQARLEDPEIDRSMLANYKAVANSLLTLRDTQMALSRLVDRAMLVYGVEPQTVEKLDFLNQTGLDISTEHGQKSASDATASMTPIDKAQLRAKIAAEERLANEVDAQKSAMRGLSDDGYVRGPNTAANKSFEGRGPLDHSLYRPFGTVLESLGSELPSRVEASKPEEEGPKTYNDAELVAEVQKAYEDTYGPISVGHQQLTDAADKVKQEQENDVKKFEMLKDDPTTGEDALLQVNDTQISETIATKPDATADAIPQAVQDDAATAQAAPSTETATSTRQSNETLPDSTPDTSTTANSSHPSIAHLPTHYTILIHDAETNSVSLTTSTSPPPRDTSPFIPLHSALSTLHSPSKFMPYITPNLEIVTAKPDMLILRDAVPPSGAPSFQSMESSANPDGEIQQQRIINPIDGTTRLSPTGYVGPEENREQLEREFDERRREAERVMLGPGLGSAEKARGGRASAEGAERKRGGKGAGVVKTAIWAAATCYVVGVLGELVGSM